MAPAVFVPKKSRDLQLCIHYRELNKQTTKDAYPLPLPDEVQDQLAGSKIFTKLDLHSRYWQLPVNPQDREKTAFRSQLYPGPTSLQCVCQPHFDSEQGSDVAESWQVFLLLEWSVGQRLLNLVWFVTSARSSELPAQAHTWGNPVVQCV